MTSQLHKNSNMKLSLTKQDIIAGAASALLRAPLAAFAETSVDTRVNASVGSTGVSATVSAAVITRAKTKADTEIDRRTKALADLNTRVQAMTKVSAELKQALQTNIQTQVSGLTTLKTKIDADTDGATLRTDVQSITQAYRVFALLMPQARIAAAADREATIVNMLAGIGAKLRARIDAAQTAGKDVTAISAALTDMGTKLTSAQAHAQAAVSGSATLTPDQGDKDKMKSNTDALVAARKEIASGHQDLVAARKDVDVILKGLRTVEASGSASTTVNVQ